MSAKSIILCLSLVFHSCFVFSQQYHKVKITRDSLQYDYAARKLILPSVLIGVGFWGLQNHKIKDFNENVQEEVVEHIDKKITIDDFSQYLPAATVYALNAFGVKGKNNFRDRSVILATSLVISGITVTGLKHLTKEQRPDGTAHNSFPSGHTTMAFAGAEFLRIEYKDVSPWYGFAGYVVAAGTGIFRVYNNRHWCNDIVAGAGFGILSTKIAYWMNPFLSEKVFHFNNPKATSASLIPVFDGKHAGIGFSMIF
ncbi:phosphatase PAP2 family protein [soil metagenome]